MRKKTEKDKKSNWLKERLIELAKKALSLSFLTWIGFMLYAWINGQVLNVEFLTFTVAVIGVKTVKGVVEGKQKSEES